MKIPKFKSKRTRHTPGSMNATEAAYELVLRQQLHAGGIAWYAFETLKLRMADKTFWTPDFAVLMPDGSLELHEVKGHWEDDARVKVKVVAELFPFFDVKLVKPLAKFRGGGFVVCALEDEAQFAREATEAGAFRKSEIAYRKQARDVEKQRRREEREQRRAAKQHPPATK